MTLRSKKRCVLNRVPLAAFIVHDKKFKLATSMSTRKFRKSHFVFYHVQHLMKISGWPQKEVSDVINTAYLTKLSGGDYGAKDELTDIFCVPLSLGIVQSKEGKTLSKRIPATVSFRKRVGTIQKQLLTLTFKCESFHLCFAVSISLEIKKNKLRLFHYYLDAAAAVA